MPGPTRCLSRCAACCGAALALGACGEADQPSLVQDRGAVSVEPDEEWNEAFVAPEYTEAVCLNDWPFVAVQGASCTARDTFTCGDGQTLQSALESVAAGCGLSASEGPLELSLSGGCVTAMACAPSSAASDPTVLDCLASALGALQVACSEQPACIRLFAAGPPAE